MSMFMILQAFRCRIFIVFVFLAVVLYSRMGATGGFTKASREVYTDSQEALEEPFVAFMRL
jgi:hypothetical protein